MNYAENFRKALQTQIELGPSKPRDAKERFQALHDILGVISEICIRRDWPHTFVRARPANDLENEDVNLPKQLSYTPCCELGRANLEDEPVFYGGDDPVVVLLELNAQLDDEFYMSKWTHPGPLNTALYSYKREADSEHIRKLQVRIEDLLNDMGVPDSQKRVLEDCTRLFLDPKTHILSSLLAHHLFNEKSVDAIEFLSVKSPIGLNYALSTNTADQMILEKAIRIRVEDRNKYKPLFFAELDGGEVRWQKVTTETPKETTQLVSSKDPNSRLRWQK